MQAIPTNIHHAELARFGIRLREGRAPPGGFYWKLVQFSHADVSALPEELSHHLLIKTFDTEGADVRGSDIVLHVQRGAILEAWVLDRPVADQYYAAEVPLERNDTVSVWMAGLEGSDTLDNLHVRHPQYCVQGSELGYWAHHSFELWFQQTYCSGFLPSFTEPLIQEVENLLVFDLQAGQPDRLLLVGSRVDLTRLIHSLLDALQGDPTAPLYAARIEGAWRKAERISE